MKTMIGVALFMERLGFGIDNSTVTGKVILQKSIYIGQLAGANFGYVFGWYNKGPYSPELNYESMEWEDNYGETTDYKLCECYLEIADMLKKEFEPKFGIKQDVWLELLASILWVRQN